MISPASIDAAIARSFAADAPITSVEGDDGHVDTVIAVHGYGRAFVFGVAAAWIGLTLA